MAATNIYFISETQLKDGSVIEENTDMKVLKPLILLAQDQRIQPIIGSGIYAELKTQIQANTLTSLNTTLLDNYIVPALRMWVMYEYTIPSVYKYRNKNTGTQNSENNSPADMESLFKLMDYWKDKAEWYSERITMYLLQNATSYPLYQNAGNGVDTIFPNTQNFSTNILLDDGYPNGLTPEYIAFLNRQNH